MLEGIAKEVLGRQLGLFAEVVRRSRKIRR